ncbi:oligosaccharide repeat unit polymerase [Halomonas sp. EF61]|uniref:O-antigen polymerase n=1 Tax=Halomonas sp. EF61 TaxID=2950869 RepID=UPI0032DF47D3
MIVLMSFVFYSFTVLVFCLCIRVRKLRLFYFHNPSVSIFCGVFFFIGLAPIIDFFFYNSRYDFLYPIVWFYCSVFFLGLSFGFILSSIYTPKHFSLSKAIPYGLSSFVYVFIYILGVVLLFFLYYRMPEIPIFSEDVHEARVKSLVGLGYNYKISLYCIYVGYLGVSLSLMRHSKILAFMLSLLTFLMIMPTANRIDSLFVIFVYGVVFVYFYEASGGGILRLYTISLIIGFVVLFVSAVVQYIRHYGIQGFAGADINDLIRFSLGGVYHRFWVQLENLSYMINNGVNIPLFKTFINDFLLAIPGSHVNQTSGVLLKQAAGVEFRGGGITPTFIGEGYAQFGYVGTVIYCLFLSSMIGFFSNFAVSFLYVKHNLFPFLFISSFFLYGISTSTLVAVFVHAVAPVFVVLTIFVFVRSFFSSLCVRV